MIELENREEAAVTYKLPLSANRKAAVLAPSFSSENSRDGYIQRIKAIDKRILSAYCRAYFVGDIHENGDFAPERFGAGRYFIRYNSTNEKQAQAVEKLCTGCRIMYIHSAYRFVANVDFGAMRRLLDGYTGKIIWDVHGAVPEEISMNGDEPLAEIAAGFERDLYKRANIIVCVNRAMRLHLQSKYGETKAEFIIVPIVSITKNAKYQINPEAKEGEVQIIYSGGTQKWQNVPQMLKLVLNTKHKYSYTFAVTAPHELQAFDNYSEAAEYMKVVSMSPEAIEKEYPKYHYGLLLRDDTPVNRVACPTKLVEYIRNGVVPVLKTENIGDFASLGLKYITINDLENGNLPSETCRMQMAESNHNVLKEIEKQYEAGVKRLRASLRKHGNI